MLKFKKIWIIACLILAIVISFLIKNGQSVDSEMTTIPEELQTLDKVEDNELTLPTEIVLYVDVKGEVNAPGVYLIEEKDKRVDDLIRLAGGFTEDADVTSVNLAQKVHDEMVIFVPKIGQHFNSSFELSSSGTINPKMRINYATIEEISTLNGIGEVKATAIVKYREENGFFQTVDDLLMVSGIGEKTLEKIKDQIQAP